MPRIRISPAAEQDIESILSWTRRTFGEPAQQRYEALLFQAISDILDVPDLLGDQSRDEILSSLRTYHLSLSRRKVPGTARHVRNPRHFIIFRRESEQIVEIVRILHDSMDLESNLPDDLRDSLSQI